MLAYRKNVYSQNGEDGILAELLNRLPETSGWVCEFGACDGKRLSNTFRLVEQEGYSAVYIECDESNADALLQTAEEFPSIHPIIARVMPSGPSSLDSLLETTLIPRDFDILSIDIDSYDYQVWEGVSQYSPKIVVIEINSDVIDPWNMKHIHGGPYQGTAFLPMVRLGERKGYTLVVHTGNLIFVRNDLAHAVGYPPPGDVRTLFLKEYAFL
jgi:hypothetical protein